VRFAADRSASCSGGERWCAEFGELTEGEKARLDDVRARGRGVSGAREVTIVKGEVLVVRLVTG
jgi:hypothetical protein